nr:tRNA pseudouridine(55) synthase TruB [Propionibacteriaceae bacterium]
PAGWTSHDVVGRLRRLLGERKIGHAGTLDPAATGVLPVAVGDATKTLEYLTGASKTYLAEITFGVETDSYDADGRATSIGDQIQLNPSEIERMLESMLGPQMQIPPMHSAIKIGGQRLYEAARRGQEIERPARPVVFNELDLVAWIPPIATVLVDCSTGTYVRSLANDLGRMAGCGAHLSGLVRLRSGPFELCDAWTITELSTLAEAGPDSIRERWSTIAIHPDVALMALPALLLSGEEAIRWQQGKSIPGPSVEHGVLDAASIRAYDATGQWIGIGVADRDPGNWHPKKVVSAPLAIADSDVEG